ncbi:MAG: oligosaccharide flippase family protein [Candidatus Micrarchaeia archaeon]
MFYMLEEEESIGRRSVRTLSSLLVGKFGGVLVSALTFIIIARLLGPNDYGIYTLAVGIYAFIGAAGHFGIGTYFNKFIAEYIYKRNSRGVVDVVSYGYSIIIPIAFALSITGILCSGYISSYFKSITIPVITVIIASSIVFFSMIYGVSYPALVSFGKGKWAIYALLATQLTNLIFSTLFILGGLGFNGALLGMLISYVIGATFSLYFVFKAAAKFGKLRLPKYDAGKIKKVLMFSLPMAANNLLNNGVSSFAVILLGVYGTSFVLGNYGTATRGMNLMQTMYGTVSVVLLPTFAAMIAKRKKGADLSKALNKVLMYSLIITFPVLVYIGVFAKPLIFILVTSKYSAAPLYLLLMASGLIIGMPALYLSSFLVGNGYVYKVLKYGLISVLLQLISLFVLVPRMLALGNIIALFLIGGIVSDFLFAYSIFRIFRIKVELGRLARIFLANALLAVFLASLLIVRSSIAEVAIGIAVAALIYPVLLVLLGIADEPFISDILKFSAGIRGLDAIVEYITLYMKHFIRSK